MKTIKIPKDEYEKMSEENERMRETIEILSEKETVKKLIEATNRIESGDYVTKEELV